MPDSPPSRNASNLYLLSSIVVLLILSGFLVLIAARAIVLHRRRRAIALQFATLPVSGAGRYPCGRTARTRCPPRMYTVWLPDWSPELPLACDTKTHAHGHDATCVDRYAWQNISPLAAKRLEEDCSSDPVDERVDKVEAASSNFPSPSPPSISPRFIQTATTSDTTTWSRSLGLLARHWRRRPSIPVLTSSTPGPLQPSPSSSQPRDKSPTTPSRIIDPTSTSRMQVACLIQFPSQNKDHLPHIELGVTVS